MGQETRAVLVEAINDLETIKGRFTTLLEQLDGADGIQIPRQGWWTKPMVGQLCSAVSHLPGVHALFDVTAAHPNEAVKFSAILEVSGLDERHQRNEHARLSRVSAQLFGEKKWPIESWQGPQATDGKAEMVYRMGATVADWWHEFI